MRTTKRLKPSKREKKRYVVFEIVSQHEFGFDEVRRAIISILRKYIGEFGYEDSKIYFIANTYSQKEGIFRVTNKSVNDVKKCLEKLSHINSYKAELRIIGISGILKKAKRKFLHKKMESTTIRKGSTINEVE